MTVIFAEKYDAAKEIAKALNEGQLKSYNGYKEIIFKGKPTIVTWGHGHLCSLKREKDYNEDYRNWKNLPLPFIPSPFELKPISDSYSQFKIVKDLFKKADLIINATDDDREGDLIFHYVMELTQCKVPFKRARFSQLNPAPLRQAFNELYDASSTAFITNAAKARSIADWIIGCNATVAMTLQFSSNDILSVGRLQTPVLNIFVRREKEIRNFKSSNYYVVDAEFTTSKKDSFNCTYDKKFEDKSEVNDLYNKINGKNGIIKDVVVSQEKRNKPELFNLSGLQSKCNSLFGFTLKETLNLTQKLYEAGYVTYPRTNSCYLPSNMEKQCDSIKSKLLNIYNTYNLNSSVTGKKSYFNDNKVSSHHAIIPTSKVPDSLSGKEAKLYDLIARSFLSMYSDIAIVEKTQIITEVEGYEFSVSGTSIIEANWYDIMGAPKETILPKVAVGEIVTGKYVINEKETKPPKRYTDKSILEAMLTAGKEIEDEELRKILLSSANKGIGTEATRADIVETLINRGYIYREKKNLIPSEKGINLIDCIPIEDIKSALFTAQWEKRLADIENGDDTYDSFIADITSTITQWCNEICSKEKKNISSSATSTVSELSCPVCGKPIHKTKWGWGCSGYKEGCKFTVNETIANKKITEKQFSDLIKKGKTSVIKGFKSKAGKPFSATLVLDDNCKVTFKFD